ncbi:MAG: undecaprenyl-diphosphate phosphatase [Pseudonocardia sp.]|uniref:undecaprenyl-diphosphate phosphatase n=1 Tax=unclassified Pseudonocardia TaxID=2619320 RepID=UPI00086A62E6|nr:MULTISPECIES: undecaprenyl-diphosphate phosphatase [unclassified Pseudonocardia]MBN9107790.1 undecaprenyl-diphosphate phosphatase [Pseudonocardia sp.]ODU25735.1 MAG: undecaprenyl-diphosphatase [Pseudonocardia sp. SCN 72-51]ODV07505.1 MAG: undecaprenyl-diphosphatase [Pseudonocardia sp. SCN 73-27]
MSGLGWVEAIVVGALQGVAELFPVSSLGHSILLPAVLGGSWAKDLDVGAPESPYLAFVVGLHVATAIALIVFFRRDWLRIIRGLVTSIARREVVTPDQRLAWLLVLATIPVGIAGLTLEHLFRTVFSRPVPTAIFLVLNGFVLLAGERLTARSARREAAAVAAPAGGPGEQTVALPVVDDVVVDRRLSRLGVGRAVLVGAAQIAALLPGISRSGSAMVTGLSLGLPRADAARFSFLLATPVILAAGVLKLGDLAGPLGDGIRPQILVGSILSGVGAYLSVRFLTRYFENKSLRPFGIYCIAAGVACLIWFAVR